MAAHGWLGLGSPADAAEELGKVAPEFRSHPEVLQTRWTVCASRGQWAACTDLGRLLIEADPADSFGWINRSYALRRAPGGGVEAAYEALLPALDQLKDIEQVTFNLGCYSCLLGRVDEARRWLVKFFALARQGRRLQRAREMALQETDLQPLWPEVGKL